ncbi:MAG: type II secretion system protein [Gammaproteobacteria bacterium]|nr:type II secretion system protein [Gammaproteobacteria bacterium]
MRRKTKGFTYLELVVVIVIISTLLYFAFDNLWKLQISAERAVVVQTVGNLQSAIGMTIAAHIARGDIAGLKRYVGSNPIQLLAQTPNTYLGVFPQPPSAVPGGSWYFRTDTKSLIYKVEHTELLSPTDTDPAQVEFKLMPVYDDNNRNGRFDAGDTLTGLRLSSSHVVTWISQTPPAANTHTNRVSTR